MCYLHITCCSIVHVQEQCIVHVRTYTKRTQDLGLHDLGEDCLVQFEEYLASRYGGRKKEKERQEIMTDVSKFLFFADPDKCDLKNVLSCRNIRQYVVLLEGKEIGPSGILTKLWRLVMATEWLILDSEDTEHEEVISRQAGRVKEMVSRLSAPLRKDGKTTCIYIADFLIEPSNYCGRIIFRMCTEVLRS